VPTYLACEFSVAKPGRLKQLSDDNGAKDVKATRRPKAAFVNDKILVHNTAVKKT
jgi:hypothetical protein